MFKFSSKSTAHMHGIDGRLIQIAHYAIQISKIDFGIPESGGLRTVEQQKALYDKGRSMCDGVEKKSKHQSGRALDFYAYVDGKASWDELHLAMVATAFLQAASMLGYKLKWGALFSNFKDMPHVEIVE